MSDVPSTEPTDAEVSALHGKLMKPQAESIKRALGVSDASLGHALHLTGKRRQAWVEAANAALAPKVGS
jgi:hypothetical protein